MRFFLVGITSTLVYLTVTNCMMFYRLLPTIPASILGYLLGISVSYYGQKNFTFNCSENKNQFIVRFVALSIFGIVVNSTIIHLLINYIDINKYMLTFFSGNCCYYHFKDMAFQMSVI
ncbi:GtrA family protein [Photobacterium profundum]|uniref:GtrA family protein n=1 Tax=Photobacterium profundum TaxID=74109 RepID=UPI003D0B2851